MGAQALRAAAMVGASPPLGDKNISNDSVHSFVKTLVKTLIFF